MDLHDHSNARPASNSCSPTAAAIGGICSSREAGVGISSTLPVRAGLDAGRRAARGEDVWVARASRSDARPRVDQLLCPPDRYVLTIALADSEIAFGAAGRLGLRSPIKAGALYVATPGERLTATCSGPYDLLQLYVARGVLEQDGGLGPARPPARLSRIDGVIVRDPMIQLVGRLLTEGPEHRIGVRAEELGRLIVARLLLLLAEKPSRSPLPVWRLNKVRRFIEENLAEPVRLADVAAAAGLSRMHFAAQFKAATGMRPHEYLLVRRIERAKELMAAGPSSLVQVALDVGFQSQAHFCTIFRRLSGMTPSAWRREAIERPGGTGVGWPPHPAVEVGGRGGAVETPRYHEGLWEPSTEWPLPREASALPRMAHASTLPATTTGDHQ